MLQVRYTFTTCMWKLVIGWRRWDGSVLNAFSPAEFHMQHIFFSQKWSFSNMSCFVWIPQMLCWVSVVLGHPNWCHWKVLKLSLSTVVISPSFMAETSLACCCSPGSLWGERPTGPAVSLTGNAEAAWVLEIPIRENFGCNFNATSPPFLSPFRQLAFFGN